MTQSFITIYNNYYDSIFESIFHVSVSSNAGLLIMMVILVICPIVNVLATKAIEHIENKQ